LCTLCLSTSHRRSFEEATATIKGGTDSLWRAALALSTLSLSTSHGRSFEEAFATLEVGADSLFCAALALLALGLAARFHGSPQETSRTVVNITGCLLLATFLVGATVVIATNRVVLKLVLVKKTSSALVSLTGCLLVAAVRQRARHCIAATC
jgi:hypothetical protein